MVSASPKAAHEQPCAHADEQEAEKNLEISGPESGKENDGRQNGSDPKNQFNAISHQSTKSRSHWNELE